PAPVVPPGLDLTPEEFEHVFAGPVAAALSAGDAEADGAVAPVTAVIASHLGARQGERVRDYARHLAGSAGRVGLIELDAAEFRLSCYDPAVEPGTEAAERPVGQTGTCDPREVAEALEELNIDVDRWLVAMPAARTPEAKELVGRCEHWALLCSCDHDGVVSAYRALKGAAEARPGEARLSLAVIDAAGDAEAARVHQKLAAVVRQFLGWEVEPEPAVRYAANVAEHPLMNCRVARDKAQIAAAPHWDVVVEFLGRERRATGARHVVVPDPEIVPAYPAKPQAMAGGPARTERAAPEVVAPRVDEPRDVPPRAVEPPIHRVEFATEPVPSVAPAAVAASVAPAPVAAAPMPAPAGPTLVPLSVPAVCGTADDVIDLPGDPADAAGILSALLRRPEWGLVECPLTPPAPTGGATAPVRLAVGRDRGLVLVGVARKGLAELRAIGHAYRWATENQALIAMAVPQFAIDAGRAPTVTLLVDQTDVSAEALRPMMGAGHVTVRAYRTLRWAGRTGLLLEAA
ncbi:MAG TPA: hypothetical protein VF796_12460, partial [Humisphaera sp.]